MRNPEIANPKKSFINFTFLFSQNNVLIKKLPKQKMFSNQKTINKKIKLGKQKNKQTYNFLTDLLFRDFAYYLPSMWNLEQS